MSTPAHLPPPSELQHISEAIRHLAVPIDSVNPDPHNANKHSAQSIADIRGSLLEYGQDIPLVANKTTRNVIKGNGRLEAAISAGWKYIAVVFVDESEVDSLGRAIADNQSNKSSEWDYGVLREQLQIVNAEDAELRQLFDKLFDEANAAPTEGEDGDTETDADGTNKELASKMELQFNEHYDYLLVLFRNSQDWNRAVTLLGLQKVHSVRRNKAIGLGRGVRGDVLLKAIDKARENGRVHDRSAEQGQAAQHEDAPFSDADFDSLRQ